MKKIFLLFFSICLLSIAGNAQGTLQFNQVLLVSSTQTVPPGKVWKIESMFMPNPGFIKFDQNTGGSCGCSSSGSYSSTRYVTSTVASFFAGLNNVRINGEDVVYSNGSVLWLGAGSTLETITLTTPLQTSTPASSCYSPYWIDGVYVGCGPYTPPQVSVTPKLSVLEFNVIP